MVVNNMGLPQVEMLNRVSQRYQIQALVEAEAVLVGQIIHQVVLLAATVALAS